MLQPPTPDQAARLREFFIASRYTEAALSEALGGQRPPSPEPETQLRLAWQVRGDDPFALLVQLFYFGNAVTNALSTAIPADILSILSDCGALKPGHDELTPVCLIFPFEDLWIASDFYPDQGKGSDSDTVMGVNPTGIHLLNFTVRKPVSEALDLGTGCGIQALYAARHSARVVATDINPKGLNFTAFNAALNGLDNIECLQGDCFEPVSDRKFEQIISNPPFFMNPSKKILFVDNDMELDGFCRKLAKEAPSRLKPGGFFQMTCEWVQVQGQSWQERLTEWADGSGCDVWVLKANTQLPETYAENRLGEAPGRKTPADFQAMLDYYAEKKVVAIHGGFMLMRKRDSDNWVRFDELQGGITNPVSDALLQGFAAQDFLQTHQDDEQLLDSKLRLSPGARLHQDFTQQSDQWQISEMRLQLHDPLPFTIGLDADLAGFLAGFDGNATVSDRLAVLSEHLSVPMKQLAPQALTMVRTMLERRFLLPEE